jgi:hypothetical protein
VQNAHLGNVAINFIIMRNFNKYLGKISMILILLLSINITAQNPANKNNPYDYYGKIHNEVLIEFRTSHKKSNMTDQEKYQVISELIGQNSTAQRNNVTSDGDANIGEFSKILENYAFHLDNDFKDFSESLDLSDNAQAEAQGLMVYILKTSVENKIDFNEFYSHCIEREGQILNSRISDSDKEAILGAYSIARYSYVLWTNNSFGHSQTEYQQKRDGRGFWGTLAIIGGDVAGFIAGTPIGEPVTVATWASDEVEDAVDGK